MLLKLSIILVVLIECILKIFSFNPQWQPNHEGIIILQIMKLRRTLGVQQLHQGHHQVSRGARQEMHAAGSRHSWLQTALSQPLSLPLLLVLLIVIFRVEGMLKPASWSCAFLMNRPTPVPCDLREVKEPSHNSTSLEVAYMLLVENFRAHLQSLCFYLVTWVRTKH